MEYASISWGDETLTLLRPTSLPGPSGAGVGGAEPYVIVPELVQKVFHHRAFVSMQQRSRLGITIHPATSFQVHALRARGTVDANAGKGLLIVASLP